MVADSIRSPLDIMKQRMRRELWSNFQRSPSSAASNVSGKHDLCILEILNNHQISDLTEMAHSTVESSSQPPEIAPDMQIKNENKSFDHSYLNKHLLEIQNENGSKEIEHHHPMTRQALFKRFAGKVAIGGGAFFLIFTGL